MFDTLSTKTIIYTLFVGMLLFSAIAFLMPAQLLPGGKIATIETETYTIDILHASYEGSSLIFSYTAEAKNPKDILVKPLTQQPIQAHQTEKMLDKVFGDYKHTYIETYTIENQELPQSIIVAFQVDDAITRAITLEK